MYQQDVCFITAALEQEKQGSGQNRSPYVPSPQAGENVEKTTVFADGNIPANTNKELRA